jgi:hypothetical protein
MNSEIVQFDLEDPSNRRVASEIIDLLCFYKTGVGTPRDIVTKMRFVVETYCDVGSGEWIFHQVSQRLLAGDSSEPI